MKKDLFIKVLEYCSKFPEGFNYKKIIDSSELKLKEWEKDIIDSHFSNAYTNYIRKNKQGYPTLETIFLYTQKSEANSHKDEKCKFIINFESKFKYIDYLELIETRESSKQANKHAIIAIAIAGLTFLTAIIFSVIEIYSCK